MKNFKNFNFRSTQTAKDSYREKLLYSTRKKILMLPTRCRPKSANNIRRKPGFQQRIFKRQRHPEKRCNCTSQDVLKNELKQQKYRQKTDP